MTDDKKKFTDEDIKNLADRLFKTLEHHHREIDETISNFLYDNFNNDSELVERFQKEWGNENIVGSNAILDRNCNEIFEAEQNEEKE